MTSFSRRLSMIDGSGVCDMPDCREGGAKCRRLCEGVLEYVDALSALDIGATCTCQSRQY